MTNSSNLGRHIIPRWTNKTANPPNNLQAGEIATSLVGDGRIWVGRPPNTPILLRPGMSISEVQAAIASEAQAREQAIDSEAQARQAAIDNLVLAVGEPSASPPTAPVVGQRWLELTGNGQPAYPWPWEWDGERWLSLFVWSCLAGTGRNTGNADGNISPNLPPSNFSKFWLDSVRISATKTNNSQLIVTLEKVTRYDNQFSRLASHTWPSGTEINSPQHVYPQIAPSIKPLGNLTNFHWAIAASGQNIEYRASIQINLKIAR